MLELISIAAGLASFGINLYTSFKKNEISEKEYKEGLEASKELERQLKALRPDDKWENINPQLLQAAAKYSPEIAGFVQENAPQLITEPGSATERRVQREALQKYAAMSETGRDVISEAQREQALFEADARAKSRQQRLMEGLKRQGQLGSGAALAAQLQTEQAEAQTARQEALQGVQQAEMRRREALGQAAGLAGQLRSQNLQVESANVGTMNAYNQRLANAKNMYNQYVSGEQNRAQQINQQRELDRERYNLGLANEYARYNREQALRAKERARDYDVDTVKQLAGVSGKLRGQKYDAEREFMGDVATSINTGLSTGLQTYGLGQKFGTSSASAPASTTGPRLAPTNLDDIEITSTEPKWDTTYTQTYENPNIDLYEKDIPPHLVKKYKTLYGE